MPLGIDYKGTNAITKINEINFFDIKRYASKLGADLLFGQGIVVNSDNENIKKYLNQVCKENRIDGLLQQVAEETNYWGATIMTINKTKTGQFMFSFATPELFQNVEEIEITPFFAKLMIRKVVGTKVFFVNEYWTTTDVKRTTTVQDEVGMRDYDGEKDELPKELQMPEYEKHNLGFVPFVKITNKEARNIINNGFNNIHTLADDFAVRNLGMSINFSLRQHFKEKWKGATRIFGSIDNSTMNKLASSTGLNKFFTDDYVVATDMLPGQNKPIEVSTATYNADSWLNGWQAEIDLYMLGCGLNPMFGSQQQQTEAEALYSKENAQRTIKQKRRRYTELLRDLFAKLIVYNGLASDVESAYELINVEIKENVVYNQLQLVDFLNNAVQYGLMTRAEAIMMQRDIDNKEDAEMILKEIEKDQEARSEIENNMLAEQTEALGQGNGGGMGNAKPGKENAPVAEEG